MHSTLHSLAARMTLCATALGLACSSAGNAGSDPAGASGSGSSGGAPTAGASGAPSAGAPDSAGSNSMAGTAGTSELNGGTSGTAGDAPATAGAAGSMNVSGAGGMPPASGSNKVLIYAVTTGFRHESIPAAATALAQAATAAGLTPEIVGASNATNMADASKFSAASLAQDGAVILLANSGEPFGYPATQEIQNLIDYVKNGGALVAIENATHCYDGSIAGHPASVPYVSLLGGDFIGHPGDVAPATCTKVGTQASVLPLPATFAVTDEIYEFSQFRMDNIVVLNCVSSADTKTVRPISWVREEGKGRYFHTALGHPDASWTMPMDPKAPSSRLVQDHIIPGLLWAMKR